jgi:hypothetical protein
VSTRGSSTASSSSGRTQSITYTAGKIKRLQDLAKIEDLDLKKFTTFPTRAELAEFYDMTYEQLERMSRYARRAYIALARYYWMAKRGTLPWF